MKQSVDGIKPKLPARIDWDALFHKFVAQDETGSAQTFLRDVMGWPPAKVLNGNTVKHIANWSKQRAIERQEILKRRMERADVSISELMPDIIEAKRKIILYYIDVLQNGMPRKRIDIERHKVGKRWVRQEKVVEWRERLNLRDRSHILTKLKTELGEPAVITKNKNENSGESTDPALTVLMQMGILVHGSDQDNGAGQPGSAQPATPPDHGQAPADVA